MKTPPSERSSEKPVKKLCSLVMSTSNSASMRAVLRRLSARRGWAGGSFIPPSVPPCPRNQARDVGRCVPRRGLLRELDVDAAILRPRRLVAPRRIERAARRGRDLPLTHAHRFQVARHRVGALLTEGEVVVAVAARIGVTDD